MTADNPDRRRSKCAGTSSCEAQEDVKIITEEEYRDLPADFKGAYEDYYGDHPEWEGKRTAAFPCELPGLFIEGVNLRII